MEWRGDLLSKVGLDNVIPGSPGARRVSAAERRGSTATCGGIRVHPVDVPNGRGA